MIALSGWRVLFDRRLSSTRDFARWGVTMDKSIYQDNRGWKYKVRAGLSDDSFKPFYQKPGKSGWHGCRVFIWYASADIAQIELDAYAAKKGWRRILCDKDMGM